MNVELWWEPGGSGEASSARSPCYYQLQYKHWEAEQWQMIESLLIQHPPQPIHQLATGEHYEVRLRCRYLNVGNFSDFSKTIDVFLPIPQSIEAPWERPRITECRSPEQETFTCRWSAGNYPNLTGPGSLKFFYSKGMNAGWKECPQYVSGESGCYFNQSYTSIWVPYCVQLKSDIQQQNITFDRRCFSIDNIVKPDPPIALNWTLLNISQSGLLADIQLFWQPPPTADIRNGWISLQYEIQYKLRESLHWESIVALSTSHPVYALTTGRKYQIRLRCKQIANRDFSEFSDTVHVFIPKPTSAEEAGFLLRLILIFVSLGVAAVLLLILFTNNQRLKVLLLPPVPVPKIKGIDPELLKKGKINEVNSIFANHLSYKAELYADDPWVEFIDVDLEDSDRKTEGSDTDRLLACEHPTSDPCLSIKDDDSGRDSCYEADVFDVDLTSGRKSTSISAAQQLETSGEREGSLVSLSEGTPIGKNSIDLRGTEYLEADDCGTGNFELMTVDSRLATVSDKVSDHKPSTHSQLCSQSSFGNMDFYAQVSDITPAGGVLLSPGQQSRMEAPLRKEAKGAQRTKAPDSAYTSKLDTKQLCSLDAPNEQRMADLERNPNCYLMVDSLDNAVARSCKEAESARQLPVPDYTSIHMVDSQHSLLLNPNVLPSKSQPTPAEYLMPEQLGNVMP
ncbi:growth hormone receptor [Callorhinchus milii]|uniref:growth hormone receptor n=1 Tax=Callorhinchus milii TaxID=7868 RepID=UPI001C3F84CC|nr:growth hormone receptor [Callorhinchus milii]